MEVFNSQTGEINKLLTKERANLTPREWEVLNFALRYVSNKQKKHKIVPLIAREFGVCEKTAWRHVRSIVQKVKWLDTYNWVFTEKTLNSRGKPNHNKCLTLQILKKKLVQQLKSVYRSFRYLYLVKRNNFFTFWYNLRSFKMHNLVWKLRLGVNTRNGFFYDFWYPSQPIHKYEQNEYLLTKTKPKNQKTVRNGNQKGMSKC